MQVPTSPQTVADAFGVRGRRVIITGAAGWIGRTLAEVFAGNGARVLLSDGAGDRLTQLAARLVGAGHEAYARKADLCATADLDGLVAHATDVLGGVDGLINCGGIASSSPLETETVEGFDRVLQTNVRSIWYLTRAVMGPMRAAGGGSIVNIASINGHRATFFCPSYAGSKAAVLSLTRECATELAPHGIRVNSVSPGFIACLEREAHWVGRFLAPPYREQAYEQIIALERVHVTNAQPLRLTGEPADVAWACVYLTSAAARFVTGADVVVDGGRLCEVPDHESRYLSGATGEARRREREILRSLPEEAWLRKPRWFN